MTKPPASCVEPAQGPLQTQAESSPAESVVRKDTVMPLARVGHEAPDFEANAYFQGGFTNVKLSDYRGKWIVLCFYPGDFTFV